MYTIKPTITTSSLEDPNLVFSTNLQCICLVYKIFCVYAKSDISYSSVWYTFRFCPKPIKNTPGNHNVALDAMFFFIVKTNFVLKDF